MLGSKTIAKSLAPLAAGLMAGALLADPSADRTEDFRFKLVWKGDSKTYRVTNSGLGDAEKKLEAIVGSGYKSTDCYRTIEVLRSYEFRKTLAAATAGNEKDTLPIEFFVQDDQTHADEGGVWPHVTKVKKLPTMRLGETGWTGDNSKEVIAATLLHEAGHMGDGSSCKGLGYGPDGKHRIGEVIAPSGAFAEGWGQYTQLRDKKASDFTDSYLKKKYKRIVEGGTELAWENTDKTYVDLDAGDLTLWDFVSNEAYVGGVLIALDQGGKNRERVFRSMRVDNAVACRTLADFTVSYVALAKLQKWESMNAGDPWAAMEKLSEGMKDPAVVAAGQAARTELEGVLKKLAGNVGTQADYDLLLSGKLASGMERHTRPRSGDYSAPAAAPAAELAVLPAEADRVEPQGGLLGQ